MAMSGDSFDNNEQLSHEAEELMRQGRYTDAANRYEELFRNEPSNPWARLGYVSALECAGDVDQAEHALEEVARSNKANRHVQRFCHMFFERREDTVRAQLCRDVLQSTMVHFDDAPPDQLADLYFNQGRYLEARTELERLLQESLANNDGEEQDHMRAGFLGRIGACMRQDNDERESLQYLEEAHELDPENYWIVSELAETQRSLDMTDEARHSYELAILHGQSGTEGSDGKDVMWIRGRLANLEYDNGNTSRAIELYEKILADTPDTIWAKVELAQTLSQQDPIRSTELCEEALLQDPEYPWAYAQLAVLARLANNLDNARTHLVNAMRSAPRNVWILHELSDVCRQMGRKEEAYTHLEHARNIAPYDATTFGYMADCLRNDGKADEALAWLNKAVELDENYTWAWREKAELHAVADEHHLAEDACKHVETIEPGDASNEGLRAFLLRHRNMREAAVPHLERALDRDPNYLWAWRELIEYHLSCDAYDKAADACTVALRNIPHNLHLTMLLAEAERQRNNRGAARAAIEETINHHPENAQLLAMRAELLLPDHPEQAERIARKACDLNDGPDFRILLAQCCLLCGTTSENDQENDQASKTTTARVKRLHADARALIASVLEHYDEAEKNAELNKELIIRSPVPFDLSAQFAEYDGDTALARKWCARGIAHFPSFYRLRIRYTRLALDDTCDAPLRHLYPLLEESDWLPWHEIVPLFARGQDAHATRQSFWLYQQQVQGDSEAIARSWLVLAESLLVLHNIGESREALAQSLATNPDYIPARLLAAMIAEQDEDFSEAVRQLEHVHTILDRNLDGKSDDHNHEEHVSLTMQLATLAEQAGKPELAHHYWSHVSTEHPNNTTVQLAAHSYYLRHPQSREDTEARLKDLDELRNHEDNHVTQHALHERALHALRQNDAASARSILHSATVLNPPNAIMLAQCELDCNNPERANDILCDLLNEVDENDEHIHQHFALIMRMRIRCVTVLGEPELALKLAHTLYEHDTSIEEHAVTYAENLAFTGRYPEAIAILRHNDLPQQHALERTVLGAFLALEHQSVAHAFAWLGHSSQHAQAEDERIALFHAAWPQAWGINKTTHVSDHPEISTENLRLLPPYPRMLAQFAQAFSDNGHSDLAALTHLHGAQLCHLLKKPHTKRQHFRHASRLLLLAGKRSQAISVAWMARSPLALARALFAL